MHSPMIAELESIAFPVNRWQLNDAASGCTTYFYNRALTAAFGSPPELFEVLITAGCGPQ